MTAGARAEALKRLLDPSSPTAQAVASAMNNAGSTSKLVHRSTLVRAAKLQAKEEGKVIHCLRGLPKKALSPSTMEARLKWAKANQKTTWSRVMFTDRKRFEFKYPGVKVSRHKWVVKGTPHQVCKVNHAQGLNIYAGLTSYGVTAAHIVTGTSQHKGGYQNKKGQPARNITAGEYKDVMMSTLLPEGHRLFTSQGISSWVFQQDNDPTHKAGPSHVVAWT